ncbi:MAG: type II secretion system GspH family protein [Candidatus Omnitrophica bacterium]|nr:type II secretion system GspH family protein [Candidatus Omnitrophota bacterium]MCM8826415.1 type II secretion system GspH family protein [Candidatus Omnitrophota bacterium]
MRLNKAITLIELVIVITVLGLSFAILGNYLWQVVESFKLVAHRQDISTQAKLALDWLVRDIREIKAEGQFSCISEACVGKIVFTNVNDEEITYQLEEDKVTRNNSPLCLNVGNLQFTYRDEKNQILNFQDGCLSDIQKRKVFSIEVDISFLQYGESYRINSFATLRNVRMR